MRRPAAPAPGAAVAERDPDAGGLVAPALGELLELLVGRRPRTPFARNTRRIAGPRGWYAYAARLGSDNFLLSAIKELQDADEEAHGDGYRQVFETSNHGWRPKLAA
ncbi:hypothetical protein [uncultured Reyranella sp.]|uniref:hypothetical protein n=1 Tax=uncultured Reyranella sp. TaxID=735512 RepID=UPI00259CFBB4|nr:hypothetical protein [uncultured Reyranella sp.]